MGQIWALEEATQWDSWATFSLTLAMECQGGT